MFRLLLLAFFCAPTSANADGLPIVFGDLSGRRAGDDLVIDYRITNKSWKEIESEGIRPQLHVTLETADRGRPTRVSFDRDLARQEGTITLSVPNSISTRSAQRMRCEVWVSGRNRRSHIDWMDLGGVEVERATLRLGEGGAPPPPVAVDPPPTSPTQTNWAAEPRIIEACGAAFDGPNNEKACVAAVKSSQRDPTELISACEATMDGDDNELKCLRLSIGIRAEPVPVITACEAAMDGDGNELECIKIVAGFSKDPSQVIAACDSARSGDPDELDCLRTAAN